MSGVLFCVGRGGRFVGDDVLRNLEWTAQTWAVGRLTVNAGATMASDELVHWTICEQPEFSTEVD